MSANRSACRHTQGGRTSVMESGPLPFCSKCTGRYAYLRILS